jgi:hypothetical protein
MNKVDEINKKAWVNAQKELESAICMFEWTSDPKYVDVAIQFQSIAIQKIYNLRRLHHLEKIRTHENEKNSNNNNSNNNNNNNTRSFKKILDKIKYFFMASQYELEAIQRQIEEQQNRKLEIADFSKLKRINIGVANYEKK